MVLVAGFLSLPVSLLLLISTAPGLSVALERPWPYNLPSNVKYFPEHENAVQKKMDIQRRLVAQKPAGLQKLRGEESEMFFLDYWQFDSTADGGRGSGENRKNTEDKHDAMISRTCVRGAIPDSLPSNSSSVQVLQAPFPQHQKERTFANPIFGRAASIPWPFRSRLDKRDFQCPTGTANCASINRPNSCCSSGETCQLITDTGLGDVGCCQQGQTCGQQVTSCQTGYQSCPGSPGGGCCIPGYTCAGVGCKICSGISTVHLLT